ncbi:MAG: hypothetical protein JXR49_04225 [Acidobacteria bacterium]|nr:hypothetical protein [Acidobacteriota bacterium]
MQRRTFLQSSLLGAGAVAGLARKAHSSPSDMKITKVRVYNPTDKAGRSGWLNHSAIVVAVETDSGITGVGQGGTKDMIQEGYDFRNGKIYPNNRPGIGVVFDPEKTHLIDEITQPGNVSGYSRPDGSFTTL